MLHLHSRKSLISLFFVTNFHWVGSCTVSMSMWTFCCFCCFLSPALVHGDLIRCNLLGSVHVCFVSNFIVNLERILCSADKYFGGKFYRCVLCRHDSYHLLISVFLSLAYVLMTCPFVRVCCTLLWYKVWCVIRASVMFLSWT